ncbi:hypothetical protein NQD34_014667 [Periophthalmus magnuspinnatus]|nr:hypothetical protein NQD34_014667 [Periophthalmus magnuspinnatus]
MKLVKQVNKLSCLSKLFTSMAATWKQRFIYFRSNASSTSGAGSVVQKQHRGSRIHWMRLRVNGKGFCFCVLAARWLSGNTHASQQEGLVASPGRQAFLCGVFHVSPRVWMGFLRVLRFPPSTKT